MIETRGLTKRFGPPGRRSAAERLALRDVDLRMPAGACWAVVGPNGAGKSTLLGILLGFLRPTRGEATVDGLPPAEYARLRGAAVLPERVALPDGWTPVATLRATAALDGASAEAPHEALAAWGLAAEAHTPWRALSTGTRQRLLLAQALLPARDLVVLDEPTAGLDPTWRLRLRERLLELRAAGRTVLLASHDLGEVERVADQVLVLEGGRVREVLPAREADAGVWLLRLAAEPGSEGLDARVRAAFPGAEVVSELHYRVSASGPADLSARLAALLAAGAVVGAVQPAEGRLEERVRRALEEERSVDGERPLDGEA